MENPVTVKVLYFDMPKVVSIKYKDHASMVLSKWPTGNCQLSTLAFAFRLEYVEDIHIKDVMKVIARESNSTILFDLEERYHNIIIKKISKYISKVKVKRYTNNNGNKMVLSILKFNKKELYELPF